MLITCPKCSANYQIPEEIKLTEGKKMQCSACQYIFEFHQKQEKPMSQKPHLLPPEDAVLSYDAQVQHIVVKTSEPHVSADTKPVLPEVFRPLQHTEQSTHFPYFWCLISVLLFVGLFAMGWLWRDLLLMKSQPLPFNHSSVPVRVHKQPVVKTDSPVTPSIPLFVAEEVAQPSSEEQAFLPNPQPTVQSVHFRKTPTGDAVLIEGVLKNTTSETISVPEKVYALAYDTKGSLVFEKEIYLPNGVLYPDMEQPFFGTYTPVKEEIQWVDVVLEK